MSFYDDPVAARMMRGLRNIDQAILAHMEEWPIDRRKTGAEHDWSIETRQKLYAARTKLLTRLAALPGCPFEVYW